MNQNMCFKFDEKYQSMCSKFDEINPLIQVTENLLLNMNEGLVKVESEQG